MNVLIIDDNPTNIALLSAMLSKLEEVMPYEFTDPLAALAWCGEHTPDLVLVDYMMPELDGLQFIERFRAMQGKRYIPVIMITADTETAVRHKALELGANDFLTKPVGKIELTARVKNLLALNQVRLQLANRADWLASEVKKATAELQEREREVIYRLSRAAEFRDPETGSHIQRMAYFCRHIAKNLGLSDAEQNMLLEAAPMHDVGKVGVPDKILLKPGKLDAEEYVIMQTHAAIGASILKGSTSRLLQVAAEIALTHHEKFDGSGYPNGLKGEEIPLYGRITAVADVFDALTSLRPYKEAWSNERASTLIREGSGIQFDPKCVEAFFQDWESVLEIQQQYRDR